MTTTTGLHAASTIAAIVPHYRCEPWLRDCLASLVEQTRPLDAIFVIDDASGEPPIDIVREFPQITLLESHENVGPYRLMQQVIDETGYDGYLFQDADDWSSADRLELLLTECQRTGAAFVGTQEVHIYPDLMEARPFNYPLDVNHELRIRPGRFALLQATSIVSRRFIQDLGGLATGMRFSGDSEFLQRAVHAGTVRNIPDYCYFRRKRRDSLTTSDDTGLRSAARQAVWDVLRERARAFHEAAVRGEEPCIRPYVVAPPIRLTWLCGPREGELFS